jgi:hypothetical protein
VKVYQDVLGEDGKPDILKVDPIIYSTKVQHYYQVGSLIGDAFSMGAELRNG